MYKLLAVLMLTCFAIAALQAQNYNNPGGTISTCTGNFYDTGGPLLPYTDNQNITTTICPDAAGQCVTVIFNSFDIESNYDYLSIYDGPSSASPLIGRYTGTNSPGTVTAASGCLTFVFTSDFSVTPAGWSAAIACAACGAPPPCIGTTPACASPVPDDCSTACNLGTLTRPSLCPLTGSSVDVFCLNNSGATPATPYLSLGGCQPSGANMPNPAADVWYTFIASSNILDIRIQGLNTPNLALYEGNNCGTFIGRGCAVGSFGNVTASFQPVRLGGRYYLQIAGGDAADTSTFTLTITGRNDCDPCLIQYSLTANPLPVSTVYQPGQTVHFCFTVTQWSATAVNWIHAVVPSFGPGWDRSSLATSPPAGCDGHGSWAWHNSVTSMATGLVTGPGFFYESDLGCTVCDPANPGDNYGDNCTGVVNFVYCWDMTVANCPPAQHGDNLNVSINTYGDGESGSWTSFACAADPLVDFFATLSCCPQPGMSHDEVSCFGAQDGRIIANAQGVAPFLYNWLDSAGNVIKNITRLTPDTLSGLSGGDYTVEITDNLQCFTSTVVNISEPLPLVMNLSVSNISCFGLNDGSIAVNLSGGTAPYQYSIDGINYQLSNIFSNLIPGSYTVTATDAGNCAATQNASITEPLPLVITLDSLNDAACFSGNNGEIYTTTSGGTLPYNYNWSNGGNADSITGLPGGSYTLNVTDANSCTATETYLVNTGGGFTMSVTAADATCFGFADGSANLSVSGGALPLQYNWSNGANAEDLFGVAAGSYTVSVTDANNCSGAMSAVIGEPLQLTLGGTATDARCFLTTDGTIQLTAGGGMPPYQYSIDGLIFQLSSFFNNVPGGNYQTLVQDANNCTASFNLTINIPPAIATAITSADVSCFGGSDGAATVTATGVNAPFTYNWSSGSATAVANNLSEGIYFVTVTDVNNCDGFDTIVINQPAEISVNAVVNDVLCNGGNSGSINLNVSGGTPNYIYSWLGGQTTPALNSLTAGNYSVTVTDNHNCSATGSYTVSEPPALLLSTSVNNALCYGENNGIASVTAAGGTPGYSYQWDAAANNQTTSSATNLVAGNYNVVVTDANNCTATASATIAEPPLLEVVIDHIHPQCSGDANGSVSASASGGSGGYQFSWNTNPPINNADAAGLSAGDYTIVVMDANGCRDSATTTLVDPLPFSASILPEDATISFGDSIQLHASFSPASVTPSYLWEPVDAVSWCISPCADPFVHPVVPTTFTVYLIDPNTNCTASAQAFVNVEQENTLYIPNVFTPDGDCMNDLFEIFSGPELAGINYQIYNRWGGKLFQSNSIGNYWNGTSNGKLQNPGVYVYWVQVSFLDGEKRQLKGSFTLLR